MACAMMHLLVSLTNDMPSSLTVYPDSLILRFVVIPLETKQKATLGAVTNI